MGQQSRIPKKMAQYSMVVTSSIGDKWSIDFQVRESSSQQQPWIWHQHRRALGVAMSFVLAAANSNEAEPVARAVNNFGVGVIDLLREVGHESLTLDHIVLPNGEKMRASDCGMLATVGADLIIQATTDQDLIGSGDFEPAEFDFQQMAVS